MLDILAKSSIIRGMGEESFLSMIMSLTDNSKMISWKATVKCIVQMGKSMKETGMKIRKTAMDYIAGAMGIYMMVHTGKIRDMAMESCMKD